jgi:hypothetical protein
MNQVKIEIEDEKLKELIIGYMIEKMSSYPTCEWKSSAFRVVAIVMNKDITYIKHSEIDSGGEKQ